MKKSLLLLSAATVAAMSASGQKLQEGYIQWPVSEQLHTYIQQWNGGNGTITINGVQWEDEEFFTSRVKPRERFRNASTQVYNFTTENDKRLVWWVPIGDCPNGGFHTNALPNASLDTEVFSMWSYMDHYGNWTSPYGWAPGSFADIAHKNGVAVSGVSSTPNSSLSDNWKACLQGVGGMNAETVGKFLLYHGVDGLGYNSEWTSGNSPQTMGLTTLHNNLKTFMADKNPVWENIWYGGVNDRGSCAFDSGLNNNTELFKGSSIFLNYNWNGAVYLSNVVSKAAEVNKSSLYVYAGCNQQGGEPKSYYGAYKNLVNYPVSVGLWGAHNFNMFWQSRNGQGSSELAMQRCYMQQCEQWFGNGPRNPAVKLAFTDNEGHRPHANWAGMSALMSARSPLSWSIADEWFITNFNLGNGTFFNWEGERLSDTPWYNIGIQDYMPTWRYWFADSYLNKNVNKNNVHLQADFTWDEAYKGGSCLQISGTADKEYLHLFKTNFQILSNMLVTVRYKLLEGEADIDLAFSLNDAEAVEVCPEAGEQYDIKNLKTISTNILSVADSETAKDISFKKGKDGWVTKTYRFTAGHISAMKTLVKNVAGLTKNPTNISLAQLGLKFSNAKDMKLLLGEIAISPANNAGEVTKMTTPVKPVIKKVKVLNNGYKGVDAKVYWEMPGMKTKPEPTYNSDVNVGLFKVYVQEEGGEPVFVAATTSWAALVFQAPSTDVNKKVRFGVVSVSEDYQTDSNEPSWSDYVSKGTYNSVETVELSKAVIKPNEDFSVRFVDPNHASASWKITDANGKVLAEGTGREFVVEGGLPEVGRYNVTINNSTVLTGYIPVSDVTKGALPDIFTLSHNDQELDATVEEVAIDLNDENVLSYTGRAADGASSRAIGLNSNAIGVNIGDLGMTKLTSFTVAGWYRFAEFPALDWAFINVSNKRGSWPQNTWGWSWNYCTPDGKIYCTMRGAASDGGQPGELHYEFPKTALQPNSWTHIALVHEYNSAGTAFRLYLYINGVKQESTWFQYKTGNIAGDNKYSNMKTDDWCEGQTYGVSTSDDIYFGGAQYQGACVDGMVDDWQVWDKALSADEIASVMNGLPSTYSNNNLLVRYEFEAEANANNTHNSTGKLTKVTCSNYELVGDPQTGNVQKVDLTPAYVVGCPFINGESYKVNTTSSWSDNFRKTSFTKLDAATRAAVTEGEAGSASVNFTETGDHMVTLKLENAYGTAEKQFPMFAVSDRTQAAIGDIEADGGVTGYTVDGMLFLEFAEAGAYTVEVYNTAGMLAGKKVLNASAGQSATITLGNKGVYLVKVVRDGQALRTLKVLNN